MKYKFFAKFLEIENENTKLIKSYKLESGEVFYVEPAFITQLDGLKQRYPEEAIKVIDEMEKIVKKNKKVMFVYDYENPFYQKEDYIYLEFGDVTDRLQIFYEDKSRGSDYGD